MANVFKVKILIPILKICEDSNILPFNSEASTEISGSETLLLLHRDEG